MRIEALHRRGRRTLTAVMLAALFVCAAPTMLHAQALFERFNMAVAADRTDEVAGLLARGLDPNTVDPNGDPAVLVASRLGYERTLDTLLRAGAKVNARNRFGDTAIMVAAIEGRLPIVRKLVDRGAEINPTGWTRSSTRPPPAATRSCAICSMRGPGSTQKGRTGPRP
jgi:hypothetical protein